MKKVYTLILIFLFTFTQLSIAQLDGTLDQSFNPGDVGFGYGTRAGGYALALQPDGKILAFGYGACRLKTNGDPDSTFTTSGIHTVCIALQPDGKIVAGGYFDQFQTISRNHILRLEANGELDTTFNIGTGFDSYVLALALQTDGKVLAGGWFSTYDGDSINGIARLNADGSLDTSFHSGLALYGDAQAIVIQPDGKIIIGGSFVNYDGMPAHGIARLNIDGSIDTTFNQGTGFGGTLTALALQPDGKIIAGGYFATYNSVQVPMSIIRLNTDGTRDTAFGNIGFDGGPVNQNVLTIALQQDGKILVGGGFDLCDSVLSNSIARLDTNGVIDTTFNTGTGFNREVKNIIVQPNGQAVVTGSFSYYNQFGRIFIIRLNTDASPDTSFFMNTGFNEWTSEVALQSDGKILAMGWFTSFNNTPYYSIARLMPDGSPDTLFHQHITSINVMQGNLLVQPDGKILASGLLYVTGVTHGIVRLNTDGSIDTTFSVAPSSGGSDSPIALQPNGKIVAGIGPKWLTRLNSDGSVDSAFYNNEGTGFDTWPNYFALQPDGKIVAVGGFNSFDGHACGKIARINADGTYDTIFNAGTGFDFWGADVVTMQPDGKIIVGGDFEQFNGSTQRGIVRLNTDGSTDMTFVTGSGIGNYVKSIILQSDGKILVGGNYSSYNGHYCNSIARLNTDGSYDTTFVSGSGFDGWVMSQALQPDGKLVLVGHFGSYNGIGRNRIARLYALNTTSIPEELYYENNSISVFPNPSDKLIVISSETGDRNNFEITVTDIKGSICLRTPNSLLPATIDISKLPNGIYFVEVTDGKEKAVKKFIKN